MNDLSGIKVAVGSKNPVKVQSVKNALNDENIIVIPCSADSNVREQPLSEDETLQGAINRAKHCLELTDSTLAFGLEAGIVLKKQVFLCHFGALVDKDHNIFYTNGPLILLLEDYREPLLNGQSLEALMHQTTGIENLGKKAGAIGVFTQNRLNRELSPYSNGQSAFGSV